MKKLVRDGVRMTSATDKSYHFKLCRPNELMNLLLDKLHEETKELERAVRKHNRVEVTEEGADIIEVVEALVREMGLILELQAVKEHKRLRKGGFNAGVVLITRGKYAGKS